MKRTLSTLPRGAARSLTTPLLLAGLCACISACNVESTAAEGTPIDLSDDETSEPTDAGQEPAAEADAGADGGSSAPGAAPARGFVVVHSDYVSASVSVVDLDGTVLSDALISSGSTDPGLSLALSGDVVLPSQAVGGDSVVLIDRGNNVLNWVDLESAEVSQQVGVGPGGFAANPYDYAQVSATKAFVSRYATNGDPGQAELDEGGDLLILDPSSGELTGRVDLARAVEDTDEGIEPHADSVVFAGGRLYVNAVATIPDFSQYAESRLVTVDPETEEVLDVLVLEGMKNCGEAALSPAGTQLAISCWGSWGETALAESGIALIDISGDKPRLVESYSASDLAGAQINSLAFASDELLLFTTFGSMDAASGETLVPDTLQVLELTSGETAGEPLLEVSPYMLAGLACAAGSCLAADAETDGGVLQLLRVVDGEVQAPRAVRVDSGGLPPAYIGLF